MKQTIGLHEFRNAFQTYGRDNHFSYEGSEILFNALEDLDENMELDVIALCCDFSEMTEDEVRQHYTIDEDVSVEDFLSDNTWLCGIAEPSFTEQNTFVFQQF
jgi:hypothetical protein